jgi:hypothetical protein
MTSLCYVNPKNSLARDARINDAITKIACKITDIPNHPNYKLDLELLTMACIMVEHLIDNSKEKVKISKKDIVFESYKKAFGNLRPEDIQVIDRNIQYLFENEKIVKKGLWKIIKSSCVDWITRKILN